ncbi:hypothetical protein MKK88_03965 [Methylobacterium sp. E-005]|nr:hypothetical protein [Methylobacterium sp. E-005]
MTEALADSNRVELHDFGTFATKESQARARLPRETSRPDRSANLLPEPDELADRDRQLLPSHRDPERFQVKRDVIVRALRQLVRSASSHLSSN